MIVETAIHMILYIRELYPPHLFERQKKYNVPVHVARHPELVEYVKDMIRACRPDLEKGAVERICLVVVNKAYTPVERFVFEIDALIDPKSIDKDAVTEGGLTAADVEAYLRAFLLKISLCDAVLHPNPPGKQANAVSMQPRTSTYHHSLFPFISASRLHICTCAPT
ncbi:DNA-binding protein [Syncephalis fuscata]|nr:DNA-binding protein [Syncephalis fuscata]